MTAAWIALPAAAYLLGSLSFSVLVGRFVLGRDVRGLGSGNAGATNVYRAAGRGAGIAALLLDGGKGAAAVAAARWLAAPAPVVAATAVAVVLGHVFPLFFGFRGGKGVATSAGALAVLAPLPTLLAGVAFAALVAWTRYVSLGSVVAALLLPVLILLGARFGLAEHDPWVVVAAAVLAVVVIAAHADNLRRLRAGEEPRLDEAISLEDV